MNIKQIREELMLTQQEFARLIGVALQTVSNWETGRAKPYPKHKRKIVEICEKKGLKIQCKQKK